MERNKQETARDGAVLPAEAAVSALCPAMLFGAVRFAVPARGRLV